jgi:hypothetical protein
MRAGWGQMKREMGENKTGRNPQRNWDPRSRCAQVVQSDAIPPLAQAATTGVGRSTGWK